MIQLPCDLLPPHLAELCCGDSPRFTARQCFAHANAWRSQNGLPELAPLTDNAEPTRKVHAAKLVQTRIDEQVVRGRQDESPKQANPNVLHRHIPCQFLGEQIQTKICKQCGRKGVPAAIFGCSVHGQCTLREYKVGAAKNCLTCREYAPATIQRATWAVGVTTAPRTTPTLSETLLSVHDAGWQPVVYAEPESPIPDGVPVVQRSEKQGAWKNWLQTAHQLVNADMSHVLIMQDDVLVCRDAKELVESEIDNPEIGCCTLYTSAKYHKERSQVHDIECQNFWGACALAFRTSVLRQVLASKVVTEWSGDAGIDNAVGKAVNALGLKIRGWSPSLAQHIGQTSSLWSTKDATGNRAAKEWRGEPTTKLP